MYGTVFYPQRYRRPFYGRPRYNYNSGYGFGVPFLLGFATGSVLTPNYYNNYSYYPYYY